MGSLWGWLEDGWLFVKGVIGGLFPRDDLYPADDLYPY